MYSCRFIIFVLRKPYFYIIVCYYIFILSFIVYGKGLLLRLKACYCQYDNYNIIITFSDIFHAFPFYKIFSFQDVLAATEIFMDNRCRGKAAASS